MFEAFPLTVNPWLPVGVLWSTFLLIPESQLPPANRRPVPNPARIELLGWTLSLPPSRPPPHLIEEVLQKDHVAIRSLLLRRDEGDKAFTIRTDVQIPMEAGIRK